jgi:hypothetical protein
MQALGFRDCVRTPIFVRAQLQFTQRYEGPQAFE